MVESTDEAGASDIVRQRQSGFWAEVESLKSPEKKVLQPPAAALDAGL
ncbi:hypothetical protein MY1884_008262 [Beauveria asiatica]